MEKFKLSTEIEDLLKRSSDIIIGIENLPPDFADIQRLIKAQTMLSTVSYHLSTCLAREKREVDSYSFLRKYRESTIVNELLESGEVKSISRAEYKAKERLYDVEVKEKHHESCYSSTKLVIGQINAVLDGLAQRISYLKQEKSLSNFISNERMGN